MKIYNYDAETHIYIGTSTADPCPLEEGVWHIPAHATTIELPPEKDGYFTVFDDEKQEWFYAEIPKPVKEKVVEPPPLNDPPIEDPLTKLKDFLASNPDVADLLKS